MHVDGYRAGIFDTPPFVFLRRYEEPDIPLHVKRTGESYWNGYVWYTAPHEDGECAEHDPSRYNPES